MPTSGTVLSCPTPWKRSWSPPSPSQPYSLKCERAPEELFSGSEVGLFGWWTAEQEELVWGVHELQLLSSKVIANNSTSESYQLKTSASYPVSKQTNNLFRLVQKLCNF